jgi:hypothetical protein
MEFTTIIKKGTEKNPVFMVHKELRDYRGSETVISEEDDNLPVFQPFPEYIEKEELEKFDCELITMECKFK